MSDLIRKLIDFIMGPEAVVGEPGYDPSQEGIKTRAARKTWLLWIIAPAGLLFCGVAVYTTSQVVAATRPTATATVKPTWTPEATLPAPGVVVAGQSPTAAPGVNALTAMALLPSQSPTPTRIGVSAVLTDLASSGPTATPCATSGHFLTEIACNADTVNATMAAVGVGTVVNQSGQLPNVTTVYVYPTPFPPTITPWIITATVSPTPVVVTATQGPTQTPIYQVITATQGPTQTPFFYITQPPIVTVVIPQTVVVQQTVIVQQTVVVTATPTDIQAPTNTPAPTETPTP